MNRSVDSFEVHFEEDLDSALDNITFNNRSTTNLESNPDLNQNVSSLNQPFDMKDNSSISDKNNYINNNNGKESFEMKTFINSNSINRKSFSQDTHPLLSNDENLDPHNNNSDNNSNNRRTIFTNISLIFNKFRLNLSNLAPFNYKNEKITSTQDREIHPNKTSSDDSNLYSSNQISNAKYNAFTFIPTLLYEQFKFFYNLYFLIVALSQAIPVLRIGYLSSYVAPLCFVLTVTMSKEALDDIQRRRRDKESNGELYEVLQERQLVPSKDLKVGDLLRINKGNRVPADMVLLKSSESSGESFIKTDQLDGETDWKLRIAPALSQKLSEEEIINTLTIVASPPRKEIHSFLGKIYKNDSTSNPLSIDNTLWANTVLASTGSCIGCVIYTGKDTRQSMNTTSSKVKVGLLEIEINNVSKILCASVFVLSVVLVAFAGFHNSDWYIDIMRYLILFSTIIPVSLRVNLDLAKSVYSYQIQNDALIPETIVRTSTIPEDLGRIEYLLSDKTGTLTQNDMELKKIHLGTVSYTSETFDLVAQYISLLGSNASTTQPSTSRRDFSTRVCDLIVTLALCHNVTPVFEDEELTYQAASPDEVAIVKFTEQVGLSLFKRDRKSITLLHESTGETFDCEILNMFPFNSDTKRMGIIVHFKQKEEYWFLQKGADTVMAKIVENNEWLEEETDNMAREGLRTLVIGRRKMSKKEYDNFSSDYHTASLSMTNRDDQMAEVINKHLEHDLELLGLTGVEDKLQKDVKSSIELLRNAGIKIWMLTGDKVETARCVSLNAKLISRGQNVITITKLNRPEGALSHLDYIKTNQNSCLLIDGESLAMFLTHYRSEFFEAVVRLPAVIACRCTPQQKADVALLIREITGKRVCCIGDGGNDVSMIQCADVGVGIVGKEGKQASLAADFSVTQFCHITKLFLWHGRNSYKRSAKLAQFVMHRGLVIAVCQTVYSICSKFEPLALYQGWLMVGYATCYTMFPVFSLTLDHDIPESLSKIYPELYRDLRESKSLSYRTFFVWCALSCYQGCVIQNLSQIFTSVNEIDFTKMVAISFTALILNELIMVALEIYSWNPIMIWSQAATLIFFMGSIPFLSDYYNLKYMCHVLYFGELFCIISISILPVWASKFLYRKMHPPSHTKVQAFVTV
ncbi:hypothetical protein TBLA_0D04110 [Henningerozyma blattae CBS 6284]|uniref:Phospholipid-transporting ATPase n=1 Tax=Henningerozyma blattae (strain ATCC 34711 / CBS 6284 / DSM 70876 / NBRC 10599 / NRRL Y-10934 / UCD 77-7) TaxID=1071380 RepID=I2H3F6_HENB6|nr:hypothetical protein TBLA_0D04110 [Tetrapisispora blattae CBS 6284]CCH60908.1 hypothetical protein TBLA_0D04110 [Tetrapisispora blattae CBS 6284]